SDADGAGAPALSLTSSEAETGVDVGLPGLLGVSSPHAAPVGGPVRPRLRARGPVCPRLRARPPRPVSGPDARFVSSSRGSGRTHLSAARRPQGHDLT